jgi:hypothetical protein
MTATTTPDTTALETFRAKVAARIDAHPIVQENHYTKWFARGEATQEELERFVVQFSVFSHLFLEAQLRKCLNAPDVESYRAGKEILMNELGVVFTRSGSVDGGTFTFRGAHFEWLNEFASVIGLRWDQIGKRHHGYASTLAFCDSLVEWYGSFDESTAAGASYAIEHWAAAGFWKELISGLRHIKTNRIPDLPLGFWTWHDQLEEQHAQHTDDELAAAFVKPGFSEERFLVAGEAILNATATFWNGLEADRLSEHAA